MSEEPAGNNHPEGYEIESLPYIPSPQPEQNPPAMEMDAREEKSPPVAPVTPPSSGLAALSPLRKRGRILWMVGGVIGILLLIAAVFVVININRSTPEKTLGTFCSALQAGDYHTAYEQFSQKLQSVMAESAFASIFTHDKVTACTYSAINETGNSATAGLKLVHASRGTNSDGITLAKDEKGGWKIDDFYRQT
jgi:hypothetical protein